MISAERWGRIRVLVRKEFLQLFRDSRMRRMILITPIVQLFVFGYTVSTDVRRTSTFLVDLDGTSTSRALVDAFVASGYFRVVGRSDRPRDLVAALDHGRAIVGLEIPRGFARDVADRDARVQVLLDGTNSNTATIAMGYAERIVQSFGAGVAAEATGAPAAPGMAATPTPADSTGVAPPPPPAAATLTPTQPPIDFRPRAWFNPDLSSRVYNVPAVIGAVMMLVALMLTSLAVVRERELGTLEQLMVSPLTPGELIVGKTIPFALVSFADLVIITTLAILWFHVPFRGSFLLLLLAGVLYLLSALGLGLLISTMANTQQEAFLSTFMLFQPATLLSGFMFPVTSMPTVFRWITAVNPVRHFLEIVRGIFLKGAGLGDLWPQYLSLAVIGSTVLAFAARRFQKTAG